MSSKKEDKQPTPREHHLMEILESLAKKLDGKDPVSLDANERGLAAGALRYLAQHVPEDSGKRGPGNPNLERKFNHSWAAARYDWLRAQNVKPTAAYKEIANLITGSSPDGEDIEPDAVRMAINAYRRKQTPK